MCVMSREKITQNLRDTGCEESTIAAYLQAMESGDEKRAKHLIARHREKLLDQFHKSCGYIECLDYFLAQSEQWLKK